MEGWLETGRRRGCHGAAGPGSRMRHLTRGSGRGEATSAIGERGRAGPGGRGFARGAWGKEAGVGERREAM